VGELGFLGAGAGWYLLLAASPGPKPLVITHRAANESRRHAVCVGLGISTASVLRAALAAAGLGLLMQYFAGLQRVLLLHRSARKRFFRLHGRRRRLLDRPLPSRDRRGDPTTGQRTDPPLWDGLLLPPHA